jgi:hypothetical protein
MAISGAILRNKGTPQCPLSIYIFYLSISDDPENPTNCIDSNNCSNHNNPNADADYHCENPSDSANITNSTNENAISYYSKNSELQLHVYYRVYDYYQIKIARTLPRVRLPPIVGRMQVLLAITYSTHEGYIALAIVRIYISIEVRIKVLLAATNSTTITNSGTIASTTSCYQ